MLTPLGRCSHYYTLKFTIFHNLSLTSSNFNANPIASSYEKIYIVVQSWRRATDYKEGYLRELARKIVWVVLYCNMEQL